METVLMDWPLVTPVLAAALLAWSLLERRAPDAGPRLRDPTFLLPLVWPMYLLHQFEEHGFDAHGERYAFLGSLCHGLGYAGVDGCPADEAFIFAVNVIACPLAFLLPYAFRRTRPLLAAVSWGVPLVNAVAHIANAAREGQYNPGVVTSVLLFLPLSLWLLRVLLVRRLLRPVDVGVVVGSGVALHAILLGSVQLRAHDVIGSAGLFIVNALNGFVPLAVGWWPSRPSSSLSPSSPSSPSSSSPSSPSSPLLSSSLPSST